MKQTEKIDSEQFTAFLQDAVSKVTLEEDPAILNEYKKLFKKTVPLTLRSYVAAYLAKTICGQSSYNNRYKSHKDKYRESNSKYTSQEKNKDKFDIAKDDNISSKAKSPRVIIDDSVGTKIFIGIGKNRHVYRKDLVGLISQVAQIDRDRIGLIRVLDNYSFVQLFTEDVDKVISALNEYEYRGRKLVVSYSRKKEDSEKTSFDNDTSFSSLNNNSSIMDETTESENVNSSSEFLV